MNLDKVRRMASDILKVGEKRVWLNPQEHAKIAESMTKDDVRGLIKDGLIKKRIVQGHSKARANVLREKKKKGLKKGKGKRKGSQKARTGKKSEWISKVRAQRRTLKKMKEDGVETKLSYGKIYRRIKGGYFKGKKYVEALGEKK